MNRIAPLLPLICCCCHAQPHTEDSATATLAKAEAQYAAAQALYRAYEMLYENTALPPVHKDIFLKAFATQIQHPQEMTSAQLSALYEAMEAYKRQQLRQADFLTPHAAQPEVVVLPGGIQYDVYRSETEEENYYARRAHNVQAYIPGTDTMLPLSATPLRVEDALYTAPRGLVWRFILPTQLLDTKDAETLGNAGIHTVEIRATRPTTTEENYQAAAMAFAAKKPALPRILPETEEQHSLRSALWGRMAADGVSSNGEETIAHIAALLHLLHRESRESKAELEHNLRTTEKAYFRALTALTKDRQAKIAEDIMFAQQEISGTIRLSNGVLCRTLPGKTAAVDIRHGARFLEYEELGSATYFRVKQRIINTETDLPAEIMQVVTEIPRGSAWELIIPPQLRTEAHLLPVRYRIYSNRQHEQVSPTPMLPSIL